MRVVVVADVHAHLKALEAVLSDAGKLDEVWCLGDIVDLGPEPEGCVQRLRDIGAICVAGNHDRAAAGRPGPEFERALLLKEANPWTRARLSDASVRWLAELPDRMDRDSFVLIHDVAHLNEPGRHGPTRAPTAEDRRTLGGRRALVGHFHLPFDDGAIVNPGPVGVPDWRPGTISYAIVDNGVIHRRVLHVDPSLSDGEIADARVGPKLTKYWLRQAGDAAVARGDLETARALLGRAGDDAEPGGRHGRLLQLARADLADLEGWPEAAQRLRAEVKADREAMSHPVIHFRATQGLMPVDSPIDVTRPSTSR